MRALLWITLVLFTALTADVLWLFGYAGFVDWAFHNLATTLLFVDLAIALTIVLAVLVRHARAAGVAAWPYVLLTLAFGSAGPLLYFARHWASAPPIAALTAREATATPADLRTGADLPVPSRPGL
jgi:hypothetical protein